VLLASRHSGPVIFNVFWLLRENTAHGIGEDTDTATLKSNLLIICNHNIVTVASPMESIEVDEPRE